MIYFIIISYIGMIFMAKSMVMENPTSLAPLKYLTTIYALLIDIFVFNFKISYLSILGSIIVVFSCMKVVSLKNKK